MARNNTEPARTSRHPTSAALVPLNLGGTVAGPSGLTLTISLNDLLCFRSVSRSLPSIYTYPIYIYISSVGTATNFLAFWKLILPGSIERLTVRC